MGKPRDPSEGGGIAGTFQCLPSRRIGTFKAPPCPCAPPHSASLHFQSVLLPREEVILESHCTEGLFPLISHSLSHLLSPPLGPPASLIFSPTAWPPHRPRQLLTGWLQQLVSGLPESGLAPSISSPHCSQSHLPAR